MIPSNPAAPRQNDQGDWVCEHGTAMDVHCCNCRSGFLFDASQCTCLSPAAPPVSALDQLGAQLTKALRAGGNPYARVADILENLALVRADLAQQDRAHSKAVIDILRVFQPLHSSKIPKASVVLTEIRHLQAEVAQLTIELAQKDEHIHAALTAQGQIAAQLLDRIATLEAEQAQLQQHLGRCVKCAQYTCGFCGVSSESGGWTCERCSGIGPLSAAEDRATDLEQKNAALSHAITDLHETFKVVEERATRAEAENISLRQQFDAENTRIRAELLDRKQQLVDTRNVFKETLGMLERRIRKLESQRLEPKLTDP